jgi:hypothetical protein
MSDNELQPRTAQIRAYLFDGGTLCALICAVGLAWWFDLAGAHEANSQPTLFAHDRSISDEVLEPPAAVANDDVCDPTEPSVPEVAPESQEPVVAAAVEAQAETAEGEMPASAPAPASLNVVAQVLPVAEMVRAPPKPEHEVEFFEVKSRADSVAFVVDCSASMQGGRFARALEQLIKSVDQLAPDQQFFVVFFDQGVVPLFPGEPAQLATAEPSEKARFLKQVKSVGVGSGTNPESSLELAIGLNPDIIYLLSDGEFAPPRSEIVESLKRQQIKVQTIAFETTSGRQMLLDIAAETGGTFCFVPAGNDEPVVHEPAETESPAAALLRTGRLRLNRPDVYLAALADDDPEVEQAARKALVALAAPDVDFGPAPGGDADAKAQAIAGWKRGLDCRRLAGDMEHWPPARLDTPAIKGNPRERLAALIAIGKRRLALPQELISLLQDSDPAVRIEFLVDIAALAPSQEPGLRFSNGRFRFEVLIECLNSSDADVRAAAARALRLIASRSTSAAPVPTGDTADGWKHWWLVERDLPARPKLLFAQRLYNKNKFRLALDRFREIEQEFPGTPSAVEAHELAEAAERKLRQK